MNRRILKKERTISVWCNPQPPQRLISYRTLGWKYIRTESMDGRMLSEEVYNLLTDSGEQTNLLGKSELLRQIMGEKLRRQAERFRGKAVKAIEKLKRDKVRELTNLERARVRGKIKRLR